MRTKEGKEGGENEREEGIERETMGARGTSRHAHVQPIIWSWSGPAPATRTQAEADSSQILHLVTHKHICRNSMVRMVKLYRFAYTNLHKHTF